MIVNPEAQKIRADVHTFAIVSERPTLVGEQTPDKVMKDFSI